jgi:hypothetical protein
MAVKMARSALVGLAGSVAIGAATRMAGRKPRRTSVLGVAVPKAIAVPKDLKPAKFMSGRVDYPDLMRRIGDAAELIERRSDEVRLVSSQAKRISRKLA